MTKSNKKQYKNITEKNNQGDKFVHDTNELLTYLLTYLVRTCTEHEQTELNLWYVDKIVQEMNELTRDKTLHVRLIIDHLGPQTLPQLDKLGIPHPTGWRAIQKLQRMGIIKNHKHTDKENPSPVRVYGLKEHKPIDFQLAAQDHANIFRKKGRLSVYAEAHQKDMNRCNKHHVWYPEGSECYKCKSIQDHRDMMKRRREGKK